MPYMELIKCSALKPRERNLAGPTEDLIEERGGELHLLAKSACLHRDIYSFPQSMLSVSFVSEGYPNTYKQEGIIFKTSTPPKIWLPVSVPTYAGILKLTADYSKKTNADLRDEFAKRFIHNSFDEFMAQFPNIETAKNEFVRVSKRHLIHAMDPSPATREALRIIEREYNIENPYTEIIFDQAIHIRPTALFSSSPDSLIFLLNDADFLKHKKHFLDLPVHINACDYFLGNKPITTSTELFKN